MATARITRNDPCTCGSGKKFKHCCLRRNFSGTVPSPALNGDGAYLRRQAQATNYTTARRQPTVRIGVGYTFADAFGKSEVSYSFEAAQRFVLTSGLLVTANQLAPGMEFWLEGGAVAKITRVDPPKSWEPPFQERDDNGNSLRRVVGTIKHVGFFPRIDFGVGGTKVETTPGHTFWSENRQAWIPAAELQQGEYLRNRFGHCLPVEWIGPVRFEFCELYNCEVEDHHTYFVGGGDSEGIWSHNGLNDACRIAKPAEPLMTTPGGQTIPKFTGGKTSGVFARSGGSETSLLSGYAGPSKGVRGIPQMNGNIKSHVEAHARVLMRREGLQEATLYINRIPCPTKDPRSLGCFDALPHMLPKNARLRVIGPNGFDQVFTGLPDPAGVRIRGL